VLVIVVAVEVSVFAVGVKVELTDLYVVRLVADEYGFPGGGLSRLLVCHGRAVALRLICHSQGLSLFLEEQP